MARHAMDHPADRLGPCGGRPLGTSPAASGGERGVSARYGTALRRLRDRVRQESGS
ncbi:hypothetical protein GCM10010466_43280 [Planomonospora alba]|uniref:Uncharacterized protein n=1 Tax=Planomonospora alba TaxID=161354 RepID=A0ABP6NGF5_9ACTN